MASVLLFHINLDLTVREGDTCERNLVVDDLEKAFLEVSLAKKMAKRISQQIALNRKASCRFAVILTVPGIGNKCRVEARLEIPTESQQIFSIMPDYLATLWGEVRMLCSHDLQNRDALSYPKRVSKLAKKLLADARTAVAEQTRAEDAQTTAAKQAPSEIVIFPSGEQPLRIKGGEKRSRHKKVPAQLFGWVRSVNDDLDVVRLHVKEKGAVRMRHIALAFDPEHRETLIEIQRLKAHAEIVAGKTERSGGVDGEIISVRMLVERLPDRSFRI